MNTDRDRILRANSRRTARLGALGAFIAVALTVSGIASGSSARDEAPNARASAGRPAAAKAEPIVIGMPLGLSGFLTPFDGVFLDGAKLAVARINAKGGVLGRPLKIITADTGSNIARGTSAALDVIGRGAQFVLPTVDYDYGSPAARAAQEKNIISITQTADPRFGRQGIGPLAFNMYAGAPTQGAAIAQFAFSVKKWRRPYVLTDITLNSEQTVARAFQETWKRIAPGNPVAGVDTFRNADPTIATQIARLKALGDQPDVLFMATFQPGGIGAFRQIRAAGITLPIIMVNSFDTRAWLKAIPNEKNAYASASGVEYGDPNLLRRAIFDQYRKTKHRELPQTLAILTGYSAVQALDTAITRAKSTETNAVRAQLEKFRSEPLAIGPTTYTSKCHIPLGRPFVFVRLTLKKVFYVATVKPKWFPPSPC